ncbi:MAG: alanyl-tRNA editing protein [Pseudomonadota bacterium]
MTTPLFLEDAYRREAPGRVLRHTAEDGIVLDASLFYATSGGQPGDSGVLRHGAGETPILDTVKGEGGEIVLIPAADAPLPEVGVEVVQQIDWSRRHRHMRVHTALHLLSVVIPLPVTGGQIGAEKGRLDFNMPEAPEDKAALEVALNALIAADHPVGASWISEAELAAQPELVKTMSVRPPTGAGQIRLVRIGPAEAPVDLQPCGGTHVASTAEIGPVTLGKIEKKGRQNRRVSVLLTP